MCSVRQRPMPSAPNSRATAASCGVSALVRTSRRARSRRPSSSASPKSPARARGVDGRHRAEDHLAGRAVERDHSRPRARRASPTRNSLARRSRSRSAPQPATQHLPMPRATTAACDVMPPRAVRMPSRGVHAVDVLGRGLDAHEDRPSRRPAPRASASSAREDDLRRTPRPATRAGPWRARASRRFGSSVGCSSWSSEPASTRRTASSRVISRSRTMSTAILHRGARGALAVARLQHPELAALDRELDVLHVAVVRLEPLADPQQLLVRRRHRLFERREMRLVGAAARPC